MRAGQLRHRVTVQTRVAGSDALGGPTTDWADVATVWADVNPLSGRELIASQGVRSEVSHLVTLRWQQQFADPKQMAANRLVYNNRIFNIHASIDVDERHRELELSCSEGANEG